MFPVLSVPQNDCGWDHNAQFIAGDGKIPVIAGGPVDERSPMGSWQSTIFIFLGSGFAAGTASFLRARFSASDEGVAAGIKQGTLAGGAAALLLVFLFGDFSTTSQVGAVVGILIGAIAGNRLEERTG